MSDPPRLFDMFGSLPTVERLAFEVRSWASDPGYVEMFGSRFAAFHGIPQDVVKQVRDLPDDGFRARAVELLRPFAKTAASLAVSVREQGARWTVVHGLLPTSPGLSNDDLAAAIDGLEGLIGFARVDPCRPGDAAIEIRRCIREHRFKGVTISPFWHRQRADDPFLDPIYEAALAEGVPVWIHTGVNWIRTTPLTYEHPLYLDAIATRFPELVLIAGHGGWPWIADMVAVAWRHPNLYVDVSAFRPRHVATAGSGWDMLWYYLSRTLRDKVLFGSSWQLLGMPLEEILAEVRSLGLAADIEDRWLYRNAARIFGMSD